VSWGRTFWAVGVMGRPARAPRSLPVVRGTACGRGQRLLRLRGYRSLVRWGRPCRHGWRPAFLKVPRASPGRAPGGSYAAPYAFGGSVKTPTRAGSALGLPNAGVRPAGAGTWPAACSARGRPSPRRAPRAQQPLAAWLWYGFARRHSSFPEFAAGSQPGQQGGQQGDLPHLPLPRQQGDAAGRQVAVPQPTRLLVGDGAQLFQTPTRKEGAATAGRGPSAGVSFLCLSAST
jgi:hypothetical protein